MTFDMQKARAILAEMSPLPWIVLEDENGEMVIIRNPNHPMHRDGLDAWGQTAASETPDANGIAYMRENFEATLDEIERLQLRDAAMQAQIVADVGLQAEQSVSLDAAESLVRKNAETINAQANQIATLKAACIAERAESTVKGRAILENRSLQWACWETRDFEDARKQLAMEYPEIAWEEKK